MSKQERLFSKCLQASMGNIFYVLPIESHATLGIPDLYMHNRQSLQPYPIWCELKDMSDVTALAGAKIAFEPGQMNRLTEIYRSGALSFVQVYWQQSAVIIALDGIDRMTERIKKETLNECLSLIPLGPLKAGGMFPTYESVLASILDELRIRQGTHPI